MPGRAHGFGRVDREQPIHDADVEEHSQGGQIEAHGHGLIAIRAHVGDEIRDVSRLHVEQVLEAGCRQEAKERIDAVCVGRARVRVELTVQEGFVQLS